MSPQSPFAAGRYYRASGIDRLSLSEFLVDFFGSLVPGLIFTISLALLFCFPLFSTLVLASRLLGGQTYPDALQPLKIIGEITSPYWLEIFLFSLMVAFVAGHFFFRQDPKKPDRASFVKIKGEIKDEWVLPIQDFQDPNKCEFPYSNLRGYLGHRGLSHLACMVPWHSNMSAEEAAVRRTKNFINILKIRLAFYYPEKCGAISRNEAHIRLMSSTWYMAKSLRNLSVIALAWSLILLAGAMSFWYYDQYEIRATIYVLPVLVAAIVLTIAARAKNSVERFLHYQRVREIVYVLETAHTAFREKPELIQDVCPEFKGATAVSETKVDTKELAKVAAFPSPELKNGEKAENETQVLERSRKVSSPTTSGSSENS